MQVEHDELAPYLVFPCFTFPASEPMTEQIADHAEHRFSMVALRRQRGEALRELLGEEDQLVVVDPMLHQALGVLLDLVQRRRPVQPGRGEARLAVVGRIGQAASRDDILRQSLPDIRERLAVMHVRGGQFVAEHEEAVDLDGGVRLHPVLVRTVRVWRLAPSAFATGVTGRISCYDCLPLRQMLQNVLEETFQ